MLPLPGRIPGGGVETGPVSHVGIGADRGVADFKVVQTGGTYQRHAGESGIEALPVFFQITHDSVCCAQPEGAAAGKKHGIDAFAGSDGREQFRFAGGGTAAPNVDARRHVGIGKNHRAARHARRISGVSDAESRHGIQRNFSQKVFHIQVPLRRPADLKKRHPVGSCGKNVLCGRVFGERRLAEKGGCFPARRGLPAACRKESLYATAR